MKSTLGQLDFKSNAIGFLRILFASIVVWSHGWHMAGFGMDPLLVYSHGIFSSGYLAVGGFFVLSGFLITRSGETTSGPTRFLWHRISRIYPAFWACLFVTAFALAPIIYAFDSGSLRGFLTINRRADRRTSIETQPDHDRSAEHRPSRWLFIRFQNDQRFAVDSRLGVHLLICIGVLGVFTIYRFPKLAPVGGRAASRCDSLL